jgi:hypothetical protein
VQVEEGLPDQNNSVGHTNDVAQILSLNINIENISCIIPPKNCRGRFIMAKPWENAFSCHNNFWAVAMENSVNFI